MSAINTVPIKLGDRELSLRYSNISAVQLENEFDLAILDIVERLQRVSVKTVAALIAVGTRHLNGGGLTFEGAVNALDIKHLDEPLEKIMEAMRAAGWLSDEPVVAEGNAEPVA